LTRRSLRPSSVLIAGFAYFVKTQLGVRVPSTVMILPMTPRFVEAIDRFRPDRGIDVVELENGQRKDDVAYKYLDWPAGCASRSADGRDRVSSCNSRCAAPGTKLPRKRLCSRSLTMTNRPSGDEDYAVLPPRNTLTDAHWSVERGIVREA